MKLLLVTDDGRFLGTITRDDLPAEGDGEIGDFVNAEAPRIDPEAPVIAAVDMLEGTGGNRLPVVDEGGTLLGLVCWDASGRQFCVDPGACQAPPRKVGSSSASVSEISAAW